MKHCETVGIVLHIVEGEFDVDDADRIAAEVRRWWPSAANFTVGSGSCGARVWFTVDKNQVTMPLGQHHRAIDGKPAVILIGQRLFKAATEADSDSPCNESAITRLREKMNKLVQACEVAVREEVPTNDHCNDDDAAVPDLESVNAMNEAFEYIVTKRLPLPTSVEFDCIAGCVFLVWENDVGHLDLRINCTKEFSCSTFRWRGVVPEHVCCMQQAGLTVGQTAAELVRQVIHCCWFTRA